MAAGSACTYRMVLLTVSQINIDQCLVHFDTALRAHRQRNAARENRVSERLNMVKDMNQQFFPQTNIMNRPDIFEEQLQTQSIQNQANIDNQIQAPQILQEIEIPQMKAFEPREMDEIYKEASMGSVADNALGVVQKEIANPEEGPIDDMPKGSYVDYTV